MTHFDLVQTQNFLRQQANWPAKKLRRQATGAALFLLIGGGYGVYHVAERHPDAASRPRCNASHGRKPAVLSQSKPSPNSPAASARWTMPRSDQK